MLRLATRRKDTIGLTYTSPTLYYGKFVFRSLLVKRGDDGYYYEQVVNKEVPCRYGTVDEVMQILRNQYNIICNLHPSTVYPKFEECIRYSHSESLDRQEQTKGVYIAMTPKR